MQTGTGNQPESVGVLKAGDLPKNTDNWQGRVEEIEKLRQWLTDKKTRLIGIEGIGGTGKSMLATKIYELEEEKEEEEIKQFPKRFWADVSSGAIIFSDLARRVLRDFGCGVPEEESEFVNALVRCLHSGQYLLIIDNLESLLQSDRKFRSQVYEEFFRTWLEYGGKSKILVTTRERPDLKGFNWLTLKGLKKEEGAKLLQELGIQGELEAFAELVDGHPLLLTIVANLIQDEFPQDPSLERLADLGLGNLQELLTDSRVVGNHRRENVGMVLVLDASFERLTDWQKIWLQNVSVYRGTFDWEAAKAVLPQPSESYSLPGERREIEQELRKLLKRSLLEEKLNHNGQFAFQPVVLEYFRYKADKAGDQTQAHRLAIDYYYSKVKEQPWQTIDDLKEYLEIFYHLSQLGEYAQAEGILSDCYDFLDLRGYYSTIVELNQQLVQNWQPGDDEERRNRGWAFVRLGNAYYYLGQYQTAIKYYQQRLDIAREVGDRSGEAGALGGLGLAYENLGQYHKAIEYQQQSLDIAREIGDRLGEGSSLGNLGNAYNFLGQYQKAIEYYQQCLDIAREIGDRSGEGSSLGNLGNAYNSLGQYQTAIDYHQQALEIAREIGDRLREGSSLGGLGNAYKSMGQYQTAIEYQQQSLDIAREIGDRSGEAGALGGLGLAYKNLGQYHKAIEYQQQCLDIAREIGDRFGEGSSLGNLGNAYNSLGQYQTAIEYQQQSLDIAREIGDRFGEGASLGNLGNAYNSLGQYQTAIEYQQQSLDIAREIGNRSGEAGSLDELGIAYNSLEQCHKAIEYHQQSLEITREIGYQPGESEVLSHLGTAYNSLRQYQKAIDYQQQSLKIAKEIGDRFLEAFAYFNLGLALEKVKQKSEAIDAYRNARQLYEAMEINAKVQDCDEAIERLSQGFWKKPGRWFPS